jgi:hypothetical protein
MIIISLIIISCIGQGNSSDKISYRNQVNKKDTLFYYWQPEYTTYTFDTLVNKTTYQMKTYCLNDSLVYNETWSEVRSKNKNLIEFSVAHNFATNLIIKNQSRKLKLHLLKENFKDSLPADFLKISHMWKNEFSHSENEKIIFRATFAQPDTDYQYSILYTVTDRGELKIIKLEDESGEDYESE